MVTLTWHACKNYTVKIKVNGWILMFCQPRRSLPDDQTVISKEKNKLLLIQKNYSNQSKKANAKTNLKLTYTTNVKQFF